MKSDRSRALVCLVIVFGVKDLNDEIKRHICRDVHDLLCFGHRIDCHCGSRPNPQGNSPDAGGSA